ncbi:MAG: polyprenol monophosphomannose synthase [Chloroflexota bacterium]
MQITLIIPTYNEAQNLPALLSALFNLPLPGLKVLIVDDNSPDGTGEVAEKLAIEYPGRVTILHRAGKLGLRTAYLEGINLALAAGAEAVGQMDADFSHDPQKLVPMAKSLETADVALGSRYVPGGSVDERWPVWRKWLSAFGNFYARSILNMSLRDITTGYRLWRRETLLGMPLDRIKSNGYIFLVEMAYMAYSLEYNFSQVPIHFADRRLGKSKMSFKIQLEAAFRVWQVRAHFSDLRKIGKKGRVK